MPLLESGKSLTICVFVSIQQQIVMDRRTDRRTDLPQQYRALHAEAYVIAQADIQ